MTETGGMPPMEALAYDLQRLPCVPVIMESS
jgi:hypothetical protein